MTPDLLAFLRACLKEEERVAQDVLDVTAPLSEFGLTYGLAAFVGSGSSTFPARHWPWDPERVLAEIAATRAIVLRAENAIRLSDRTDDDPDSDDPNSDRIHGVAQAYEEMLEVMLQPYAGRPGWSAEWVVET